MYAETIELDTIRRSTGENKDTREGLVTGAKYLVREPWAWKMPRRKGQMQEFFYKKLQRGPGQPMTEWINVLEKAVLDMKAEGLNVGLKTMAWHLFEKSTLALERQERVLGTAGSEYEFAAVRGALIKQFPDTIISKEKRSVPDRKPSHVPDRKPNGRFKNRFRKPRNEKSGRYTAHETDARDPEEDPNSKEEESGEAETDLTVAFEREMDELASVVEELEDTLDAQDVEDLRALSQSM